MGSPLTQPNPPELHPYIFSITRNCPVVAHIPFVKDTVFFCKGSTQTTKAVFHVLTNYERSFCQKVNKSKSSIFCHSLASTAQISIMELVSGVCKCCYPFTSSGAPIIEEKYKIAYLNGLIEKVQKCLFNWSN